MVELTVGLALFILLLATRSRLERAERQLKEQAQTVTDLTQQLRAQGRRLETSELRLAELSEARPALPSAGIASPAHALDTEGVADAQLAPPGARHATSEQFAPPGAGGATSAQLAPPGAGRATGAQLAPLGAAPLSAQHALPGVGRASGEELAPGAGPMSAPAASLGAAPADRLDQAFGAGGAHSPAHVANEGAPEWRSPESPGTPPRDAGLTSSHGTASSLDAMSNEPPPAPSLGASGARGGAAADGPTAAPLMAAGVAGRQGTAGADPVAVAIATVRELLFGGNTVVRAGILVLLVGVVLLLRWAAEHSLFPIELRLGCVALGALGLVGFGFAKRHAKPGFALTLQGGGVAALYLVVFFAFRSYQLLPAALAFGLLCAIAVSTGFLSVRQDSKSLIVIAQLFGFAAPLLASTGRGSHVALFSYYLLLNLLVFAVAFFKAWRELNLLGFVFTFGVATAWGALRYEPSLFASTEPFLIAFFAVYVAIPVLYALRHPSTQGWVDGSLVFGTPLAVLGLQWALVHGRPFYMAFSVLALAAVYLCLALFIKRRVPARLGALGEAFLPIGVGFATLAIPYGLDDHNLTGAAWAVEGAGLYWIGVRQRRPLSRLAGALLQLAAGGAASLHPLRQAGAWPLLNTWFLASALIGTSGLFIAQHAHARRSQVPMLEVSALTLFVPWGILFWLRCGLGEVDAWVPAHSQTGGELAVLALLALALETVGRRSHWPAGRYPALLLWPCMAVYLAQYAFSLDAQPLSHGGSVGWPLLLIAMLTSLRKLVDSQPRLASATWAHPLALWLWSLFGVLLAQQLCDDALALDASLGPSAGNLVIALFGLGVLAQSRGSHWPAGARRANYLRAGMFGLCVIGSARAAVYNLSLASDTAPLPYLPVLNPLDISSLIGAFVALSWLRRLRSSEPALCSAAQARYGVATVCALLFAWWNAQLARSVHHYGHVPFELDALLESSAFQLACSLSWTSIALVVMWLAHRRGLRAPWIASALLLAAVVAKLFLLDLSQLSAPAKIVSFLGVGALLLLIGYVAPVPPRRETTPAAATVEPQP